MKNVTNLGPATDFYKKLALECSAQQVAVDLFMLNGQYTDIASICKYLIETWYYSWYWGEMLLESSLCDDINVQRSCRFPLFSACISKYSGGCVHHYPMFHAAKNPSLTEKYEADLRRYLTRKIGFEAVMRIRCTKGKSTPALFK